MATLNNKKGKEEDIEAYLYASDKARLVSMVTEMADRAGMALSRSVEALQTMDVKLAQNVIDDDDFIDEMEEQIDQECLYSIAMRQPMREDLRFVYAVMKISTDLERIGDQAVNISLRLKKLASARANIRCPMLDKINEMAREDGTMLSEVMQAFLKNDESVIFSTRTRRKTVHKARDEAVDAVLRDNKPVSAADITTGELFLALWILRHLSRISDHVLNLAEKVVFIATGVSPLTLKKKNQQANSDARLKSLGV